MTDNELFSKALLMKFL